MNQRPVRVLPALLYMGLIFYLSSKPAPAIGVSDKLMHFTAYGALALLLLWGLLPFCKARPTAWLLSLNLTTFYGISDEIHQSFVPRRSSDVFDIAADASGALIALLLVALGWWLFSFRPRSGSPGRGIDRGDPAGS